MCLSLQKPVFEKGDSFSAPELVMLRYGTVPQDVEPVDGQSGELAIVHFKIPHGLLR